MRISFHKGGPREREHLGNVLPDVVDPIEALRNRVLSSMSYHSTYTQDGDLLGKIGEEFPNDPDLIGQIASGVLDAKKIAPGSRKERLVEIASQIIPDRASG